MRKTAYAHCKKAPFVTIQDVLHALVLIVIALLFCLVPTRGFGQPTLGNIVEDTFPVPPAATPLPTTMAPIANPVTTPFPPITPEVPATLATPATPPVESFYAPLAQPAIPEPAAATPNPIAANQFSPIQTPVYQQTQLQQRLPQREVAVSTEHPFRQYWGVPNDPQTKIAGKPMTVTQLFAGTRSSSVRCQLLQAYWELSGLLAIYHFRCEAEKLATGATGAQQENMLTLLREQRRTAELEFVKQQWVLAGLLNQYKGRSLRESELPIPSDYPLYPRYETFADKLAWSERTQYLGRMIPIQEQLIESKNGTWKAASEMTPSASQPFFVISTQRTTAFLELTKAMVEYNKMIAEYALETIPSNVSQQQLVAAVVRLPRSNPASPVQPQVPQMATPGITLTQYEYETEAPAGIAAQPVEQVAFQYQIPAKTETLDKEFEFEHEFATETPATTETTSEVMLGF